MNSLNEKIKQIN